LVSTQREKNEPKKRNTLLAAPLSGDTPEPPLNLKPPSIDIEGLRFKIGNGVRGGSPDCVLHFVRVFFLFFGSVSFLFCSQKKEKK